MDLTVTFSEASRLIDTEFSEGQVVNTSVIFGEVQAVNISKYDGDYVIIPKAVGQMLPTKDKVMKDNVTVEKIPYAEVTNNSGGTTATIGGD